MRNLDNDEMQTTYFYFFNSDDNPYLEYKELFASSDFLYREFENTESGILKYSENTFSEQKQVQTLIEEVSLILGKRMESLIHMFGDVNTAQNNPEYVFLDSFSIVYGNLIQGIMEFQTARDTFILPLLRECRNQLNNRGMADQVFWLCRSANTRLANIEANNIIFAEQMEKFETRVSEPLKLFKSLNEKLMGKIESYKT